jgi:ketosteroid isomerase-like protein
VEHPNIDIVMGVYAAYMEGDREAVARGMQQEVRWHNSGYDPTAGTLQGIDAVLEHLLGEDHMEDYRLEVLDVLASDERVAIVARTNGCRGEATLVND